MYWKSARGPVGSILRFQAEFFGCRYPSFYFKKDTVACDVEFGEKKVRYSGIKIDFSSNEELGNIPQPSFDRRATKLYPASKPKHRKVFPYSENIHQLKKSNFLSRTSNSLL